MSTNRYDITRDNTPPLDRSVTRLLYVTVARYSEEWNSILHTHPCAEVFFITGGRGVLCLADRRIAIGVNDILLVNPDVAHTEDSAPEHPLEYLVMGVAGLRAADPDPGYAILRAGAGASGFRFLLDTLRQEVETKHPGYDIICQDLLEILLIYLDRYSGTAMRSAAASHRASRECALVHRYIEEHYKENLSLEDLAGIAHVSRFYLSHAFAKEYGISPISYLLERRIRESLRLLADTRLTLAEISEVLGFSSPSYFSQSFKRSQGIPPLAYRARCRGTRTDLVQPPAPKAAQTPPAD